MYIGIYVHLFFFIGRLALDEAHVHDSKAASALVSSAALYRVAENMGECAMIR